VASYPYMEKLVDVRPTRLGGIGVSRALGFGGRVGLPVFPVVLPPCTFRIGRQCSLGTPGIVPASTVGEVDRSS
jgi:hypothetical protein